jgi:hypothetical protein
MPRRWFRWNGIATWPEQLKDRGFRQLVTVVASHYPAKKDKAEVITEPEYYEVAYALRTGVAARSW